MRFKKERHELIYRIQWYIYNVAFLRKWLTAKSFIVDIWPGSKYPSDKQNKCFSFQIKATLEATTLGIRICLHNCYSGKIIKVWLVTPWFYANGTPPPTFCLEYSISFGQVISQNSSKPLIVKGFYLLS